MLKRPQELVNLRSWYLCFGMSVENTGVLLRRFVALCQRESDIPQRSHPLNRSPAEWSRLEEDLSQLLLLCPPSRLAILSFTHPIIVAHLQSISQKPPENDSPMKRKNISHTPPEAFILSVLANVSSWISF